MIVLVALGCFGPLPAEEARPVVTGIWNGASLAAGPLAAGSLAVVAGRNLGGVEIWFDELAAGILEGGDERVTVVVPAGLAGRAAVALRAGASDALPVKLVPAAPGIFSADGSGKGLAARANPGRARPGEAISFEATGLGAGAEPLVVWVAGRRATQVTVAEGSGPGRAQISAIVPAGLEYGGVLPLVVECGGVRSQLDLGLEVEGLPAPRPSVPARLLATAAPGAPGVRLAWTPVPAGSEVRYRLERRFQNEATREIGVTGAPSWNDAEISLLLLPQYRLRAETDYVASEYTPWTTVELSSAPAPALAAPEALRATAAAPKSIRLAWVPGAPGAQRFRLERRQANSGYLSVATPAVTEAQDNAVQPGRKYAYRVRTEAENGLVSAWSAEAFVSTPPAPPALEGVLVAGNAVRLDWSGAEPGTVSRYRLEVSEGGGPFIESGTYDANSTTARIHALNAGTGYTFRVRAEGEAGFSNWSNEIFLLTASAAPAAPTNLRGVPVSTSEVELTWINSAPAATVVRVEMRPAGGSFSEQPNAAELTRTRVTGLAPGTTYAFRVRTEAPSGVSVYSNEATVSTLASTQPRTVFLVHGLGQRPTDLQRMKTSLGGPAGIDPARFGIDATFDYSDCTSPACPANCSLGEMAERLAAHILAKAPGDVVVVGVGAGGLVARDLIAYNRGGVLTQRRLAGLVTLGTPNLGYPYAAADEALACPQLVRDLRGDFRNLQQSGRAELSSYLETLFGIWAQRQFPGTSSKWLAVSGRSCAEPVRMPGSAGCRDRNPDSDGAVCDDSALYSVATRPGATPTRIWRDPERQYSRADNLAPALCPADARTLPLSDPPVGSALFEELRRFINGL